MKQTGFIAIGRSIFDHPLFRGRPERFQAWQWLIADAAWKPERRRGPFGVVHLERGQLPASVRSLGTIWGWPKSNVDRFLKRLVREGMVSIGKPGTGTGTPPGTSLIHDIRIITICNYEKFQTVSTRANRHPGHQGGHQPGQQTLESSVFTEPLALQQANQSTKAKIDVKGSREKGRQRTKPKHCAYGREHTIWCDYDTPEWEAYAADYKNVTGADPLPQDRIGGKGRWFKLMGEGSAILPRQINQRRGKLEAEIRARRKLV